MADAFDDEGDIPKYQVINRGEIFSKGPFTESGSTLAAFDPHVDYTMDLYRSANTKIETSKRGKITKQIQAGKPNFMGNTELAGYKLSAFAMVIGVADFKEWFESMVAAADFFGGPLPDLKKIVRALEKMLTPDPITITAEVNTQFGKFKKGMYIKGFDSGCVGIVEEMVSEEVTVKTRKEYKFKYDEFGDLKDIKVIEINTNLDAESQPIW